MTAHEVLISLFWLVALAYGLYLGWFITTTLRNARRRSRGHSELAGRTGRDQKESRSPST